MGKKKKHHSNATQPAFSVISLGCPKNLTDSELMVQRLIDAGFRFTEKIENSRLVLLNTCGFLASARSEARAVIEDLLELKDAGKINRIFVTGCAVQWEKDALANDYPDVDAWFGVFDENKVADIAKSYFASESENIETFHILSPQKTVFDASKKFPLTFPHVAYLKVADGCSRFCAYCAIPKIRGPFTSRPREWILQEARRLADRGVRELIVIAQETNFWGIDLFGQPKLAELLGELQEIDGIDWIRVMYNYPMYFSAELIDLFAKGGKLLPYLDIPLQHANDTILHKMNRPVDRKNTETLLATLREKIPNLVLRTSLIVGFPGETDAMFEELCDFTEKWKFERTGIFSYSREEETVAAEFQNQVDELVKQQRQETLYRLTETISREWACKQMGQQFPVLIDRKVFDENGKPIPDVFYGRSFADAPTVDPVVIVTATRKISPGEMVVCEIVATDHLDLVAVTV